MQEGLALADEISDRPSKAQLLLIQGQILNESTIVPASETDAAALAERSLGDTVLPLVRCRFAASRGLVLKRQFA